LLSTPPDTTLPPGIDRVAGRASVAAAAQGGQMNEQPTGHVGERESGMQIEPGRADYALEILRGEQRLPLGLLAGMVAALAGAGIWAAVTVGTGYQIGWMAVAVGILVGFAVRIGGNGIDKVFGVAGAGLAFLGCLVGNLLAVCGLVGIAEGVPFFEILGRMNPGVAVQLMTATFSPIDLLFYGIAIYEGYKFSLLRLTDEDLARVLPELRSKRAA
jgi:hypothetical protein